jgi:amidohydrolase
MSSDVIKRVIAAELPALRAIRHDLHAHPELSFQEQRTSGVVQRELAALNIQFKAGLGASPGQPGTGVLGYLPATTPDGNSRRAVAFRADMDALPIIEETGKAYASCNPGVMHACGHDGHTTILLGLARILAKSERPNPVTLVFQPAEEGGGGANVMCNEGCLAGAGAGGLGNAVGRIFGLHGWPTFEVGRVASKPGPLLAATDDFTVTIRGTQAHGAYPHYGNDPIVAAAHVITALQTIASRNVGPLDSVVVTVGAIQSGTANNIIPQEVTFIGTVRTLRDQTKHLAKRRFFEIVEDVSRGMGCRAHIDYADGYPVTANDADLAESFFSVARRTLGSENVDRIEHPTMGGEDFAYYGRHAPACFFFLGLKPRNADTFPTLHQPDFDFNDDALPVGIETMAALAMAD